MGTTPAGSPNWYHRIGLSAATENWRKARKSPTLTEWSPFRSTGQGAERGWIETLSTTMKTELLSWGPAEKRRRSKVTLEMVSVKWWPKPSRGIATPVVA